MACLPYPTFLTNPTSTPSSQALPSIGRTRIHPLSCPGASNNNADPKQIYALILDKCTLQSQTNEDTKNKQLRKKYMKQSVALASDYLSTSLGLDVSIVDVEIVLSTKDLMETDGCLAACFLDAGCAYVVIQVESGVEEVLESCDVCRLPRERVVVHFGEGAFKEQFEVRRKEIGERCCTISIGMTDNDAESMKSMVDSITRDKEFKFIIQLSCNQDNNETLYKAVGTFAKSVKEDQGHIALIDPTAEQLGMSYAECMKTDRADGLYTTVVCTRSGEALGLVYSSKVCFTCTCFVLI